MSRIKAFVYSYKNKHLIDMITSLKENTVNSIEIHVRDQHPLDRSKVFSSIEAVSYSHEFWDHNYGPVFFKTGEIAKTDQEYMLLISDDIVVSPGWDVKVIDFINNHDVIVSGNYIASVCNSGAFDLKVDEIENFSFTKTNFVDSKFIFAKTEVIKKLEYPDTVKYYGENELLSISAYEKSLDVFAAPGNLYTDLRHRIVENIYTPFSLEHGYGNAIRKVKNSDWSKLFPINTEKLQPIPYINDDPTYDMDKFEIEDQEIGGQRFTYGLKAIY